MLQGLFTIRARGSSTWCAAVNVGLFAQTFLRIAEYPIRAVLTLGNLDTLAVGWSPTFCR